MSRLALTTILSLIMLRINQWIIQDSSDLLSDIYGFHCCHMVYRKPSINVHILPKDNPVLCFIRSYNTPVVIRLSSRIEFIFNSAKWVNRPTSMINTAVAITWQRMNQFKIYFLVHVFCPSSNSMSNAPALDNLRHFLL